MRKILALTVVLVLAWATAGSAAVLTFGDSDLLSFLETYDNPAGNATLDSTTDTTPGVAYGITLSGDNFRQIQIGYDKPQATLPSAYYDVSAYDTYEMYFTNTSTTDWFMANLYINTGWTDAPWSHTNQYDENTWTWLAPGETAHLVMDLTTLGTITSGGTGLGDDRRMWVSGIGFNIGSNAGSGDYYGDDIDLQVDPVPIPPSVLLLGSGLLGLIGVGRFRFRKRA
jgi:hypothetical protein